MTIYLETKIVQLRDSIVAETIHLQVFGHSHVDADNILVHTRRPVQAVYVRVTITLSRT